MNNNGNKFMDGLVLGAMLGGAVVFLLGTRTGKNLLKIVSEQGLDGLVNLLEEYDLTDLEENDEEFAKPEKQNLEEEPADEAPKRRFFKRAKR